MSTELPPHHELALGLVFQRMSVVDRLRCERVSPGWRRAIRRWGWTEQRKLDHDTLFEGVPVGQVVRRRRRFWANGKGYKNLISLLKRTGNAIRELDLDSFSRKYQEPFFPKGLKYYDPPIRELAEALQFVPRLETLNIRRFDLNDFVDFLPPTLRDLKTSSSQRFSVQTLETLSEKCPKLEEIPFSDVEYLNVGALNRFIRKFPCQKKLTVPHMSFPNERNRPNWATIEAIIGLKKLEALNLRVMNAEEYFRAIVARCPQLKSLSIGWLDGESFRAICAGYPGLRSLTFGVGDLTEAELLQLAQMPALVELKIEGGRRDFTDAVLRAIASRGQLKSLDVDYSALTDESVEHLLQTCKSLVHLNVLHSPNVTDRSLRAVIAELHRRYGDPPRVLPRGRRDPGIFYFPCVGDDSCMEEDMPYRELYGGAGYNEIDWDWAKAVAANNPWLSVIHENWELEHRKLY